MQLKFLVPFKAQENQDLATALQNRLLNIEGTAIDTSVNANKWQVPEEDLDFLMQTLRGAQLRADHAESVYMVVGKVPEATRAGKEVFFKAEVGDDKLIEKIFRGYVDHVSIQVDSDEVECSKCKRSTRKDGVMVHLCPGGWEIVHKPRVRELSIVASPAYKNTVFKPTGFAAAMDLNQTVAVQEACTDCSSCEESGNSLCPAKILEISTVSWLSEGNKDVGSRREPQEPENKSLKAQEVKQTSDKIQANASPMQAQSVTNVASGESAPSQVTYEDMMNQLTQLENQIKKSPSASDAEMEALNKKVAELESEVAKRASKRMLSKKIAELGKKLSDGENDGENSTENDGQSEPDADNKATATASRIATGKGIVATDEMNKEALGNADWFKDLLKAHSKLVGMK